MRRTDDCHKETDDQTYNYRKYCDNEGCFQTIQKPEIAVIFNKVQIKIFFTLANIIGLFIKTSVPKRELLADCQQLCYLLF